MKFETKFNIEFWSGSILSIGSLIAYMLYKDDLFLLFSLIFTPVFLFYLIKVYL